jgi:hypothetical protein
MKLQGVSFPDAIKIVAELAGVITPSRRIASGVSRPSAASKTAKAASAPPERSSGLPLDDALSLVRDAVEKLWTPEGSEALAYLRRRGLDAETIKAARLGYTPEVWLPTRDGDRCYRARGVVIPWWDGDRLSLVKIRQPEGTKPKYAEAYRDRPRIFPGPAVIEPCRLLIISEGEFDALLLAQELGDLAAVVTLGSASARPNPDILGVMLAAPVWYIATDADQAGDKAASGWPARAVRVRPPDPCKDWTEATQAGINLRRWWLPRLGATEPAAPLDIEVDPLELADLLAMLDPCRLFKVNSKGTAELVEAVPPRGQETATSPESPPPPSEGQAGPQPRARFWTAPDLADDDLAALDAILALQIDDRSSWAELIEAGRAHNAAIMARKGKT